MADRYGEEYGIAYGNPVLNTSPQAVLAGGQPAEFGEGRYSSLDDVPPAYEADSQPTDIDTTRAGPDRPEPIRTVAAEREPVTPERVTTPVRELQVGGATLDADYDLWVRAGETGAKTAEIRLWNLEAQTWSQLTHGTPVEIRLGWEQSTTNTVFSGFIRPKDRYARRADNAFTLYASGDAHATLSEGVSGAWNQVSPHRIASDLAAKVGFEERYISSESETIGAWTVTRQLDLATWLDKLATRAGNAATQARHEDPWLWYIDGNQFSFHPRGAQPSTPKTLETGASLLRAAPTTTADGSDQIGHARVSFSARCEPWLQRGSVVRFAGTGLNPDRLYRIQTLVFEASTTNGRHHVSGTAVPVAEPTTRETESTGSLPPQRAPGHRVFHDSTPTRR